MRLPNRLKIILWLLLIGFFLYLFIQRYDFIMSGTTTATDIVILLIFFALLLIPLFQEVSLFGVSFKNEFDSFKNEVRGQILNIRSDISNTISQKAEFNPVINLGIPSSESQLKSLEKTTHPLIKEVLKEQGLDKSPYTQSEFKIPDDVQYLFTVRYRIEEELKNLADVTWVWMPSEKGLTPQLPVLANTLFERNVINAPLYNALKEVISICNRAIHGKTPSERSVEFVRNMAPDIIASLNFLSKKKPKE